MNSALNSDNTIRYALYDPPPANLFGNTIYKKGSLVLHMLRRVLGDASFFAGMQLYGQRYAYGTASTADFQKAMEDASGQSARLVLRAVGLRQGAPDLQLGLADADPPGPARQHRRRRPAGADQRAAVPHADRVQGHAPGAARHVRDGDERGGCAQNFVFAVNGIRHRRDVRSA